MKVLIVEDEIELAQSMAKFLGSESFICEQAHYYDTALDKITVHDYDCILLDISLPDGNGLLLLEKLKALKKNNGVIIVSAKNSIDDKINGLNLGADDYLAKPFHMAELAARVQAVVRRRLFNGRDILEFNEIKIDTAAMAVTISEKAVPLTRKEYELLIFLLSNKNKVISKNAIAEHLTGDIAEVMDNFDFIYAHIKNLKKKLADAGCPDYIKTIYGLGYKFTT
ncbi:response regulator transcription factor [Ohtaekwangia koreensis]|uniref:DNA-binding response regulator, OmpR family, contains REC and winged-helix (WHTH) domain n=1 Tax=Ohtaekwangia koreensis TaxID=688867 RepID=A0A1T5M7P2_9BACT|nr:response regulator transcription factor [Ohtaekwangia koreensis]SKC84123.1 DNA-binding response regulator, OmpR family, contains REC and winged-helix (wHTH) domain [Ohtaekwangia koreensis]